MFKNKVILFKANSFLTVCKPPLKPTDKIEMVEAAVSNKIGCFRFYLDAEIL